MKLIGHFIKKNLELFFLVSMTLLPPRNFETPVWDYVG